MSYAMTFRGQLHFADEPALADGLAALARTESLVSPADLRADRLTLTLDLQLSAPATLYQETVVALTELAEQAAAGVLLCAFEEGGEEDDLELVTAGPEYDPEFDDIPPFGEAPVALSGELSFADPDTLLRAQQRFAEVLLDPEAYPPQTAGWRSAVTLVQSPGLRLAPRIDGPLLLGRKDWRYLNAALGVAVELAAGGVLESHLRHEHLPGGERVRLERNGRTRWIPSLSAEG